MTAGKVLVVVVVFWFVRHTIFEAVEQLAEHPLRLRPGWLVAAAGIYLLGLLPAGLFWHRLLVTLGQDASFGETLRAYYIGHLGKYVPGKAMVVVIRAGLIRSRRVNTGVAAASVFYETLTMMSVGALLAAGVLAVWFREHVFLCLVAVGLMVAAGLPILPPVFRRLAKFARIGRSDPLIAEKLERLGVGTLLLGVGAMVICWLLLGISLWAVLQAMGVEDIDLAVNLPLYVASVSLAMVAGFLSLIPGGAVVRELVLTELIAPHLGVAVALASAVLLRLVWLGSELVISGILYVIRPRKGRFSSEE
ncbi:MAG: lysylphosphatidylglycerol synthase transmembrane domain-containing protein [Planctomycetota bacterium]|nr:lysylphosphatidylglycerol synthase transmembrane domain-containing protein [Planctomycetota bacterium]